ncbi:MAG: hypothetical protein WCC06_02020 [Candidatus Aminicenantales bacterium]
MAKSLRISALLFFLFSSSLLASVTGYLKVNSFYLHFLEESSAVHLARVRLKLEQRWGSFSFKLHSEVDMLYGEKTFYSLFTGNLLEELKPFYLHRGDRFKIYHFFDRLSLIYHGRSFVFSAGRQRIPWGKAKIFSVMDVFNPYNPFALEKEERQGVDSLRMQYYFSGFSWVEGVYARRNGKNDYGTAVFFSVGGADVNLAAASLSGDKLIGAAVEKGTGKIVLRGEAAVRKTASGLKADFSLGADYQLSSRMFLTGEFLSTKGSEMFPKGKVLAILGDYKIAELSSLQAAYFHVSPGGGDFFYLRFSRSLAQNLDVYFGLFYARSGTTLWQFPKIVYGGAAFYY